LAPDSLWLLLLPGALGALDAGAGAWAGRSDSVDAGGAGGDGARTEETGAGAVGASAVAAPGAAARKIAGRHREDGLVPSHTSWSARGVPLSTRFQAQTALAPAKHATEMRLRVILLLRELIWCDPRMATGDPSVRGHTFVAQVASPPAALEAPAFASPAGPSPVITLPS
jgi:hypothetical protein